MVLGDTVVVVAVVVAAAAVAIAAVEAAAAGARRSIASSASAAGIAGEEKVVGREGDWTPPRVALGPLEASFDESDIVSTAVMMEPAYRLCRAVAAVVAVPAVDELDGANVGSFCSNRGAECILQWDGTLSRGLGGLVHLRSMGFSFQTHLFCASASHTWDTLLFFLAWWPHCFSSPGLCQSPPTACLSWGRED